MTGYKQSIVVRDDLKLPKGKLAVQVAHAAVMAAELAPSRAVRRWKDDGQKKVVLRVGGLEELMRLREQARARGLPVALVQDAGLTVVPPGTVTALGIGPAEEGEIDALTGHLKLV